MKQYKITTEHLPTDSPDDAHLSPSDPIHELKVVQYLAGLGSQHRLAEYKQKVADMNKQAGQGSNITYTAAENARIMREQNIKPGTPEWFKLWFSLPYLTNEKPTGK
jgi:hypothetical protein